MNTPIADIIALAESINDLSLRISQGLDVNSKYYNPDDAITAYSEMRDSTTAIYGIYFSKEMHKFILETDKHWQELQETKNFTPAELGCYYPN